MPARQRWRWEQRRRHFARLAAQLRVVAKLRKLRQLWRTADRLRQERERERHIGPVGGGDALKELEQRSRSWVGMQDEDTRGHHLRPYLAASGETLAELHLTFDRFDVDGDGTVSAREFQDVAFEAGNIVSTKEVRRTVERIDTNSDGTVRCARPSALRQSVPYRLSAFVSSAPCALHRDLRRRSPVPPPTPCSTHTATPTLPADRLPRVRSMVAHARRQGGRESPELCGQGAPRRTPRSEEGGALDEERLGHETYRAFDAAGAEQQRDGKRRRRSCARQGRRRWLTAEGDEPACTAVAL